MLRSPRAIGAMLCVLLALAVPARADLKLTNNDRVVFFSDVALSTRYALEWLDQFLRVRYPDLNAEIICLAHAHASAAEAEKLLNKEVLPLEPTHVVFCFGLDQPQRHAFSEPVFKSYIDNMGKMFDELKEKGITPIAMTPPPTEDARARGLAAVDFAGTMDRYAEGLRKLAAEKNVDVIDWHAAVKAYRQSSPKAKEMLFTREGFTPVRLSIAVMTNKVLEYWGAEPLHYVANADWQSDAVSASTGNAELAERNEYSLALKLTGVPIPLALGDRSTLLGDEHPLAQWETYKLKIAHMPEGGALISVKGRNPKPYLTQQFESGADLTILPYFGVGEAVKNFYNAIRSKILQFERYAQAVNRKAPEPELVEPYKLYVQAERAVALAVYKIALRTPHTFDCNLQVELAAHAAQRQKAQPAQPAQTKKPGRKRPGHKVRPKIKKRPTPSPG